MIGMAVVNGRKILKSLLLVNPRAQPNGSHCSFSAKKQDGFFNAGQERRDLCRHLHFQIRCNAERRAKPHLSHCRFNDFRMGMAQNQRAQLMQ